MEIVRAEFMRLMHVPVPALAGATGTYVLWDARARGRPTYIGEGTVLERLAQHARRFAALDGYVAITGDIYSARPKIESEILEAVLLAVAWENDRKPNHNVAPGRTAEIRRIFRRHGVLRIKISGYDPLQHPEGARPLQQSKLATLRSYEASPYYSLESEWRLRRLQAA